MASVYGSHKNCGIIMDYFAVPETSGETPCIWNHFIEEKFTFHTESSVQAGSWPV